MRDSRTSASGRGAGRARGGLRRDRFRRLARGTTRAPGTDTGGEMSELDEEGVARKVDRYGREVGGTTVGAPGRSTVTARMPASARAIARAVAAEISGVEPGAGALVQRASEGSGHAVPDHLRGRFESSLGT